MALTKTLVQHGNSLALIIDKPILELLGIDASTPLEITTDGKGLHMRPDRRKAALERLRPEVRAAYERVREKHGEVLRRLAE